MIFSLLKIPKKTAAVLSGVMIALACLWGIAIWQDLTPRDLLGILLGSLVFLLAIMLGAVLLVLLVKGLGRLIRRLRSEDDPSEGQ